MNLPKQTSGHTTKLDDESCTPDTGAQVVKNRYMKQETNNQETIDERFRKMVEADLLRAMQVNLLLDRVFGTITKPKFLGDNDTTEEVRVSER